MSVSTPKLDDGTYVVTWRVISADAHPVRGAFTFTVGTSATTTKQAQRSRSACSPTREAARSSGSCSRSRGSARSPASRCSSAPRRSWRTCGEPAGATVARGGSSGSRGPRPSGSRSGIRTARSVRRRARTGQGARSQHLVRRVAHALRTRLPRAGGAPAPRAPADRAVAAAPGTGDRAPAPEVVAVRRRCSGWRCARRPGLAGHASSGPLVPIAMPADTLARRRRRHLARRARGAVRRAHAAPTRRRCARSCPATRSTRWSRWASSSSPACSRRSVRSTGSARCSTRTTGASCSSRSSCSSA